MQYIHDFIASVARDVKVVEAVGETLYALELLHLAGIKVESEEGVFDYSCEIEKLKGALRLMGVRDDEQITPPHV